MKQKKILFVICIVFIIIQIFTGKVCSKENDEFKFEKSNYLLRGDHDGDAIDFIIPEGYTIGDVELISEDENIVRIIEVNDWDWNIYHRYFIESLSVGETRLKATIKNTNYVTYCNVKVEEPIIINVSKLNVGVKLEIDSYCPYYWLDISKQAIEISVTPLNSQYEEKWFRLGQGIFAEALCAKYSYSVWGNSIVTVRWVEWCDGDYYNGEKEIYRKTIVINDLAPIDTIGAKMKIYEKNYNDSYSIINVGESIKLNAELIEMSMDSPVFWESYQENVAIVSPDGEVTAIREGTARIEATAIETVNGEVVLKLADVYTVIVKDNSKITNEELLKSNDAVSGIIPDEISVGESKHALIEGAEFDVSWSSRNNEIATVSKNGIIKGISNGNVIIDANISYNNNTYKISKNIKVNGEKNKENAGEPTSDSEFTGLAIFDKKLRPQPVFVLNKEHEFGIYLYNIPDTEKENIIITINNEDVAKLKGIDLCNWEDGSGKGKIRANTKFLSLGEFTITATLKYNGKTYSDSYTNSVVKSRYKLSLSTKENTNPPSELEVGNKIQLVATLDYVGSALTEDVTENGVIWRSSDEKIAKVDKGLITATGEGKVTIIAQYPETDDTIIEKYEIKIIDSTKVAKEDSKASTENDPTIAKDALPQTGENVTIVMVGFIILLSMSIFMYKQYINYKEIK